MSSVALGSYPPAGSVVTRQQFDALLATLNAWCNDRGDRLVQLDERAGLHATQRQRTDVDIAFVLWQAIGERRDELTAVPWPDRKAPSKLVADVTWRAMTDRSGAALASSLPEAVALVDELAARVAQALDSAETQTAERHEQQRAVEADLVVAERLASELGDQVRAAAELRQRLTQLSAGGMAPDAAATGDLAAEDWATLTTNAARLRADLERIDAERTSMLATLADAAAKLDALRAAEADAHEAAAVCNDLFVDPPRLAIPSVDAVIVPDADLADRPWPQARPAVQSFVDLVGRVERALDIVVDTYRAPKRERDDLRGLLQAFRDKADALGQAERDDIDAAYRAARTELWSAPCDLASAKAHVDDYLRLVNSITASPSDAQEQP